MRVLFDREIVGLGSSFVWDDGQITVNDGDPCDWFFSSRGKRHKNVRAASDAAGCNLVIEPGVIQAGFWKKHTEHPAWHKILGREQLGIHVDQQIKRVTDFLLDPRWSYFTNQFQAQQELLDSLSPCKVKDRSLIEYGFTPDSQGFIEIPVYDNHSSATGRMSIVSGPKILTLQKDMRSHLASRWSDGLLVEVDFNALEARILSWIAGNESCGEDLYTWIGQKTGAADAPRSVIKEATLASVYGMSKRNFALRYQDMPSAVEVYDSVRRILRVEDLDRKLRNAVSLTNFFGRPLPQTTAPISYHVQSTAVDVACHGFLWLKNQIDPDSALPVYLIHDAIVLDIKQDYLQKLEDICKDGLWIPIIDQSLPVKIRRF